MSAFIIKRDPSRVTILTDAAICIPRETGFVLTATGSKIHKLRDESGALCCVGSWNVFGLLVENNTDRWTDFDCVVESIPGDLEHAAIEAMARWPRPGNNVVVGLAGWSRKRGRFESYYIEVGTGVPESELLVLNPLPETCALPAIKPEQDAIAIKRANSDESDEYLQEYMEQQRLNKWPSANSPNLGEVYGVGGFMERTIITRNGIESEIVKHWPDAIGEPIDPFRADAAA